MNQNLVEIKNPSKEFRGQRGLKNITMSITENYVYGLLGAGGAGKSTLMKNMTGLLHPTSGEIYFQGHKWSRRDLRSLGSSDQLPHFNKCIQDMFRQNGRTLFHPGADPVDESRPQAALGEIEGVLAELGSFGEGIGKILLYPVPDVMIDHQLLPFAEKVQEAVAVQQCEKVRMSAPEFKISQDKGAGRENAFLVG